MALVFSPSAPISLNVHDGNMTSSEQRLFIERTCHRTGRVGSAYRPEEIPMA